MCTGGNHDHGWAYHRAPASRAAELAADTMAVENALSDDFGWAVLDFVPAPIRERAAASARPYAYDVVVKDFEMLARWLGISVVTLSVYACGPTPATDGGSMGADARGSTDVHTGDSASDGPRDATAQTDA